MERPTIDQWRQLYDLARRIKEMSAWDWMYETDIFGVQHPETSELGFVSVMGNAGEHFGIAVYRGAEGLHHFFYIQETYDDLGDEVALDILEAHQLQLSFEDREMVDAEDRKIYKELGLKFRGRNAWPLFRGIEPGWLPWYISGEDARFMIPVLEQLLAVAPRLKEENTFFDSFDENRFLVRVARQEGTATVWEDQMQHIPFVPPPPVKIPVDARLLVDFLKLPVMRTPIELDIFNLMSPTLDEHKRPFFPHMMLMVDAKNGMIVGQEMFKPEPDLDSIWTRTPNEFMQQCIKGIQMRPATIHVANEYLHSLIATVAKQLSIKVVLKDELPALDAVAQMLMGFMGGFGV